ncbi:hypothetical protein Tco_1148880, partial [Tanacetum coccineum]
MRTRCSSQAPDIYFGAENARVNSVTPEGGADMTLKRQNKKRRVYMGIWSCFPKEPNDAHHSKDKGSADSDDGLPPLERNFNRISLEENDYE